MKLFRSFINGTRYIVERASLLIVIIMILNIWAAVLFRYVLHASLFWSEELGRYLMIWFGYLGIALALKENGHVNLTIFTHLFPAAVQKFFAILSNLIILTFIIIVFFKSIKYFQNLSGQYSSSLNIPMVLPYLSITVGMFLAFIMNISNLVDLIVSNPGAKPAEPQKEEK